MGRIKIEKVIEGPGETPAWERTPSTPGRGPNQWWMCFNREVAPGEVMEVMASPQLPFKGHRLAVDPAIAGFFDILDIKVGRNSFRINGGEGCAATLFPPLPHNLTRQEREDYETLLAMNLDCAQVSQRVAIVVRNTSLEKRRFSAVLWGLSID